MSITVRRVLGTLILLATVVAGSGAAAADPTAPAATETSSRSGLRFVGIELRPNGGIGSCVLRLLARGLSNKEIAKQLVISPKTVGNHIEHIYTKIGATNRVAAGLFAMQHGLLPEEGYTTES